MADPANQQVYGDTLYITIPATSLPILYPLVAIGDKTGTSAIVTPIVAFLTPALTTGINLGYSNTNPGIPTPFKLVPILSFSARVALAQQYVLDIQEGIAAAKGAIAADPPVQLSTPAPATTSPSTLVARNAIDSPKLTTPPTPTLSPPGPKFNVVWTSISTGGAQTTGTTTSGAATAATTKPQPLCPIGQDVSKLAKNVTTASKADGK